MAENSGRMGRKTRAEPNFKHPYLKYEGTTTWASVESALANLVGNGDLVEQTSRKYIVGYFCKVLAGDKEAG
jgi:hypothetical protein